MSSGLILSLTVLSYTIYRCVQSERLLRFVIQLLPKNLTLEQIVTELNQEFNLSLQIVDQIIVPPQGWGLKAGQNTRAYLLINKFLPAFNSLLNSQKLLEQAAKLSALGEMAAGIAHEINNPIALIQGVAFMIQNKLEGNQDLMKKIQFIIETTQRMDKIVNGLRYFMQDDAKYPKEYAGIQEILDSVQILSIDKCRKNGVDVAIEIIDPTLNIYCKPMQIAQVLINLVNNSFDAVKDTTNPWIKISVQSLDESVVFLVQDSGQGIPVSIQEKILQPFYTSKATTKSSGSGLGLSIAKRIVDQHQGIIKVDNSHANTTFFVKLSKHRSPNENSNS